MSATSLALVAVVGAMGALLRDEVTRRARTPLWGVNLANLVGSFGFGVAAALLDGPALVVVAGGFLGSLTTFSTWVALADEHAEPWTALTFPMLGGVLAAVGGLALALALQPVPVGPPG